MSGIRMCCSGRAGVIVLALSSLTFADDSVTDGRTPPAVEPGSPDRAFVLSGFETVDLFSGKVNFRLPLHSIGGRGSAAFTIVLPIQRNWRMVHHQVPSGADVYHATSSLTPDIPYWGRASASRYTPGRMSGRQTYNPTTPTPTYECLNLTGKVVGASTITRLTWTSADGTEQEFRDLSTGGQLMGTSVDPCSLPRAQRATAGPNRGTVFVASDGSASTFVANSSIVDSLDPSTVGSSFPVAGVLLLADGSRYEIDSNGNVASLRDRNGNQITFSGDPQQVFTLAITDPMGRTTNVSKADFASSTPTDTITFPGVGGTRTVVVNYSLMGSVLVSGQALQTYKCLFPELDQSSTTQFNPWVVSSVMLADQQSSYTFQYNSYGELARVVLPTGGAITYSYPTFPSGCAGPGISGVGTDLNIYRRLQSRQVLPDGSTIEQNATYTYTYSTSGGDPNHSTRKTMTALVKHQTSGSSTSPGSQEMHYFWGDPVDPPVTAFGPVLYAPWYESREYQTTARDATSHPLRQQVTTWQQRPCPAIDAHDAPCWFGDPQAETSPVRDTRMSSVATTIDVGLASQLTSSVAYQYDRYNNKIQTDEYNYDGTDKRTTTSSFATTLNGQDYANVFLNTDGSLTRTATVHARRLPLTSSVTGPAGLEATTTNEFDNYTSDSRHSALQTYPETVSGWDPATTRFRGNVTGVLRSYLQASRTIGTYRQYDEVGNVVVALDEVGNATRIAYDPVYSRALPTSVQNALSQTTLTSYDVETSLPISYTDSNGNTTAYSYGSGGQPDPFNRLTSIVVAGGASSTTYSYPSLKQVTSTRDQTSAACPQSPTSLVSDILYDGLGRQIQTVLHDSAGNITTEKVYDFLGRPYSVSSPHRASDAVNLTLSTFDALGRISQVKTSFDSAIVYSGYVGNAAYVVDQAGKWRETQTDALGRVTSVIEDPAVAANSPQNPFSGLGIANASGANLTTSYVYDARDDLTNVTQGQETRQFAYDSLKRLTSTNNPESGVTTYLYYDTGTLQQKQSGASVTTTFTYDALNRITNKSYAGDGGVTPAVTYCYDGVIGGGACSTAPNAGLNLIGKLTMMTSGAATRRYTAYDPLGRVLTSSQQLPTQASPNTFFYTYNRAGGLETETYPSNRIVKTCYDSAARIQSVAAGATNYASGIQYAAHGAVTSMTFGDGLVESTAFNPRQQPTQIQAGSLLTLNYTYGAANNNGNVLTQKINDGSTIRNETYGYDALNRLTTAVEDSIWSQTYVYDIYGNRALLSTSNDPSTGVAQLLVAPTSSTSSVPFNTKNQWTAAGVTYGDQRGNLTDVVVSPNSFHATYDAENRMVSTTSTVGGTTTTVAYSYDGDGKRVSKAVTGGAITSYVYNALGNLIAEYSTVPNPDTATPQYLTADALGSTRLITTGTTTPAVSSRSDYLPFGQEIPSTWNRAGYLPDVSETIKFTGKERDVETGLDNFGSRYFAGAQGRFTSPDKPFADQHSDNPQTWNLYSYGRNNPLRFVDDRGQASVDYLRRVAVRLAWEQERALVRRTGQGTRDWNAEELEILKNGGKPEGYYGHHINNVASRRDLAGDPNNVEFLDFTEHMEAHHGGNTRIPTTGDLVSRGFGVLQILQIITSGMVDLQEAQITGVAESASPFSFGNTYIVDPTQAAITLDGAYIQVTGENAGLYLVQNGMYTLAGCTDKPEQCTVDPKKLKGAQFEIVDPSKIY